jgi:S-DNA-T family DNA segregation ATPase FtsK/SpoIIIE
VLFNRPPRIQTSLPNDEIEIPAPPTLPSSPTAMNWLAIGLPLGAVLLSVVMMTSSGGGGGTSYLRFLPLMLATYLASGVTYVLGRRTYKKQLESAKEEYADRLSSLEADLASLQERQKQIQLKVNPDLDECLRRAKRVDPRLGERRPHDVDFLCFRMGLGSKPTSLRLGHPDSASPPPEFKEESERAESLYQRYSFVSGSPVTADLKRNGSLGIAGQKSRVHNFTRALLCHIVTHHWPAEVQVALISNQVDPPEWAWTRSLPHASSELNWQEMIAGGDEYEHLLGLMDDLEEELQRREQIIETQKHATKESRDREAPLPRILLIFDELPDGFAHPGLTMLLHRGKRLGVHGIFLTSQPEDVPGACGALIRHEGNRLIYQETGTESYKVECRPDSISLEQAGFLSEALSGIEWPHTSDLSQPPSLITFLELFSVSNVDDLPIEAWWDGEPPYGHLRAPVGKTSATGELIFDLNDQDGAHGPHGLIGGMTGSGKSEVLKAILLALAVTHSPYDLNFALIDYKGGAAFNELAQLPHTVGVVTDIESHSSYAERVILALTGEIEHRKRVLENARVAFGFGRSHVDEYRQLTVKRPLPRLVIVFDEFAEFKERHPEESKRLISIARQGRSLGVHLILATQNIEAAVAPEILQNSTFRICLRVSEVQDSIQMIGIPDAIHLTRGRAYFLAQTRQLFQAAYAGGDYHSDTDGRSPAKTILRIWPDGRQETIDLPQWSEVESVEESTIVAQFTEAQAVVGRLVDVARKLKLKKPPPVWPNPLPERLYLPDLLNKHFTGGWDGKGWKPCWAWTDRTRVEPKMHPLLGLYDHPTQQKQILFQVDTARGGGHLLIFGSAGTGKSSLLRTLVTSLALTRTPTDVNFYILDFGGQSTLKVLDGLPHVGAVATRFEAERIERLIAYMHDEVSRRNDLFRTARVDSYEDYNARVSPEDCLPVIYLIIDGYGDFKRSVDMELTKSVSTLISGGAASGLFLVVSASLQSEIPNDLFANINLRLTFHQADQTEYYRIVGRPSEAKIQEEVTTPPPPGRGLLRGTPPLEFQAALPTRGITDEEQFRELTALGTSMKDAWDGPVPHEIRSLPLLIYQPEMTPTMSPPSSEGRLTLRINLGQDYQTLAPISLSLEEDGPTFLVASVSPQAGKTSLLQTWMMGLVERYSPDEMQLIIPDFHCRTMMAFRGLPHLISYVGSIASLEQTLSQLTDEIDRRREAVESAYEADPSGFERQECGRNWPHILIVIDDYDKFSARAENARKQLADAVLTGGELGVSTIVAGNLSELPRDYDDPLMQRVRRHGCGILLSGSEGLEQFNNARRPPGQPSAGLPPGRGYLVRRGQVSLFQAAAFWREGEDNAKALSRRVEDVIRLSRRKPQTRKKKSARK